MNDDHSHEKDEVSFEGLDRMMGISLVLGFIFMMFVEQLADYMSGNSNNRVIATDAESLVQSSGISHCYFTRLNLKKMGPL